MQKYNYESAKGRFDLDTGVKGYPRQAKSSGALDGYGFPLTEAIPNSKPISKIGFVWHPEGSFSLDSNPSEIVDALEVCCKEYPELPLHHSHFYLLENDNGVLRRLISGTLVLGHSYLKARTWNVKSDAPKLRLSDKVDSSTAKVKADTRFKA
tara:strand:+ start:724 stop:1182 length:459 start_codon:yes stop_codon:yes gene_type:complete